MSDFSRRIFTPQQLEAFRSKRITWVRGHPIYGKYFGHPGSKYFHTDNYLALMREVLGDTFSKVLLDNNATITLQVVRDILDDHMQDNETVLKDLQVNLVVNCVVRLTRAQDLLQAKRYGYAEDLIRKGQFPAEFKLALKQALFDRNAVNLPGYVIARVHDNGGTPTIWMRD